jgi:deoxyribonuclease-1-like protein
VAVRTDRRSVHTLPTDPPLRQTCPRPVLQLIAWGLVVVCFLGLQPAAATAQPSAVPPTKPWDAVLIASFNIQVFGDSKMSKPHVVDMLARVVRQFDVVAIQEVRSKNEQLVPTFVQQVNAAGGRYHYIVGPREGRTTSKEQYTFIYDTDRIEVDVASPGVFPDPDDRLHRPPLCVRFRTRVIPEHMAFTFWLVDTHTDPDEVPEELAALCDVFRAMQRLRPDEDDVIMLGDLNAGPPEFAPLSPIAGLAWAVDGVTTNTRRTNTYDNLVFSVPATSEYLGHWGVVDLQQTFGLSEEAALEVSDHNPVWAAFHPAETRGQQPVALQPTTTR